MNKCQYILDANVLITAYRLYYTFDIAPSFWDRLSQHAEFGTCAVIDMVYDEIVRSKDPLSNWMKESYRGEILESSDINIQRSYGKIIGNVMGKKYKESARQEYADCADSWVVAHGLARNICVVTLEERSDSLRKVKIPNECFDYGISCIKTFEFLRRLSVKF